MIFIQNKWQKKRIKMSTRENDILKFMQMIPTHSSSHTGMNEKEKRLSQLKTLPE